MRIRKSSMERKVCSMRVTFGAVSTKAKTEVVNQSPLTGITER